MRSGKQKLCLSKLSSQTQNAHTHTMHRCGSQPVARPTKHISEKWPRKHKPLFGLNSLHLHLSCAIFGGHQPKSSWKSPPWGVQSLTAPGPLTLACLQASASQERHCLKKITLSSEGKTIPPSCPGWRFNGQTPGDPLVPTQKPPHGNSKRAATRHAGGNQP